MKTSWKEVCASRHRAVLDSLAFSEATEVETRLRHFLETKNSGVPEWDERFLGFLTLHRSERLLTATAGDGIELVLSVRDESGYWLFETREGGWAKGFLGSHDAERILEVARFKDLLAQ